ncbi:glutathione S-transferase family protein [Jiella sp. MQZ9-1]|uniref:Glutathione S-transferase family protein n=1 Tax=Jiella flava TaxID=2816857 RepID=A0A939JUY9_9HYPH|nr:glutathione S-transferase family protein [Jiella flava]MBO0661909.1 glutathione S-transferase family protein [Jiella flava]MCD2470763.1 glutathione S-transferase family protein [Jiella flava]
MITLYHCVSARSFRVLWALEELERPYELVMLPFPPRVCQRSFLEINPLGTIPFMIDGDVRMSESAAICQYLAAMSAPTLLQVGTHEGDFGTFLNFLHFGESTLTVPQTLILRYGRFEPEERRLPGVVDDYTKWFLARLRAIGPRLSETPYLAAGRFTIADISVGYALMLADIIGLSEHFEPGVRDYWERLEGREAFQRARRAENAAAMAQEVSNIPAPLTNATARI